jgi:hypothetical protein
LESADATALADDAGVRTLDDIGALEAEPTGCPEALSF